MGAEYDDLIFEAKDLKSAVGIVDNHIDYCQSEYGRGGYTGTFAECPSVQFEPHIFSDMENARQYLEGATFKWDSAILVRFREDKASGNLRWIAGGWFSS
tara:strand:- start:1502 stop:1801 length:300 start_codon:yes stop_codon:yes gene_type:complete